MSPTRPFAVVRAWGTSLDRGRPSLPRGPVREPLARWHYHHLRPISRHGTLPEFLPLISSRPVPQGGAFSYNGRPARKTIEAARPDEELRLQFQRGVHHQYFQTKWAITTPAPTTHTAATKSNSNRPMIFVVLNAASAWLKTSERQIGDSEKKNKRQRAGSQHDRN